MNANDDSRNIVYTAARICFRNHRVHQSLRSRAGSKQLLQTPVIHHSGEAIAGKQENITLPNLAVSDVRLHVPAHPDTARNHVALLVILGTVTSDQAGVDLLLHDRMIVGDLTHLAVAKQINARIAYMADDEPVSYTHLTLPTIYSV